MIQVSLQVLRSGRQRQPDPNGRQGKSTTVSKPTQKKIKTKGGKDSLRQKKEIQIR